MSERVGRDATPRTSQNSGKEKRERDPRRSHRETSAKEESKGSTGAGAKTSGAKPKNPAQSSTVAASKNPAPKQVVKNPAPKQVPKQMKPDMRLLPGDNGHVKPQTLVTAPVSESVEDLSEFGKTTCGQLHALLDKIESGELTQEELVDIADDALLQFSNLRRYHVKSRKYLATGKQEVSSLAAKAQEKHMQKAHLNDEFERGQYMDRILDTEASIVDSMDDVLPEGLVPENEWHEKTRSSEKGRQALLERGLDPNSTLYRLYHYHYEAEQRDLLEKQLQVEKSSRKEVLRSVQTLKNDALDHARSVEALQTAFVPALSGYTKDGTGKEDRKTEEANLLPVALNGLYRKFRMVQELDPSVKVEASTEPIANHFATSGDTYDTNKPANATETVYLKTSRVTISVKCTGAIAKLTFVSSGGSTQVKMDGVGLDLLTGCKKDPALLVGELNDGKITVLEIINNIRKYN